MRGSPTARATWGDVCSLARRILGLMKARCLYEPARVLFGLWGRLVPLVSFSSDALGMPWEFMGVYTFLWEITLDLVLHRAVKQHVEYLFRPDVTP